VINTLPNIIGRWKNLFFLSLGLLLSVSNLSAQTTSYSQGGLQLNVFVSNPCNGLSNGFIRFTVLNTGDGLPAQLSVIIGPTGPTSFFGSQLIPVGGSFTFNASNNLPAFSYGFIMSSNGGADVVNTFSLGTPVVLTALSNLVVNEITRTDNTNCASPDGVVIASVAGGSKTPALTVPGSFTFTWSSSNGLAGLPLVGTFDGNSNLNLATQLALSGLPGGTYSLNIQDNYSSCSQSRSFIISDPSPSLFSITSGSGTACSGSNFTVTLSGSDSPIPAPGATYEILRNGSATGLVFPGTGAAPFNMSFPTAGFTNGDVLTVRSSNGFCTPRLMTGSVVLNIASSPTAAVLSGTTTICAAASTNLSVAITGGTAPFSFTITGLGLVTGYASGAPISVNPVTTTIYTLGGLVTDANGCTVAGSGTASVTVNPVPTASISSLPGALCAGGSSTLTFSLTGSGPFNVGYTDGITTFNLSGISNGHTVVVSPPTTRTYTISSITDATSCAGVAGANTTITVNPPPTSATLTGLATICAGQSTDLSVAIVGGTPPYSFTITGLGAIGAYISGSAISVNPAITTNYSLTGLVNDANGCNVTGTGSALVTVNQLPVATISSLPGVLCTGGNSTLTFTLTGTAPFNVSYTDGTSTFALVGIFTGHTVAVNPVATTSYTITSVSDATTCVGVAGSATTVTVNPSPTSATLSGNATICAGQSTNLSLAILSGTAPFSFTITGLGPVSGYISGNPILVSPLANTIYTLSGSVTDANGCPVTGVGSASVIVNPIPIATVAASPSVLCGGGSSTLTFTLTGTAPFNVDYSDGVTTFNLVGISTGHTVVVTPAITTTYAITAVTDATTCVGTPSSSTTVAVNPSITSATLSGNATICAGQSTNLAVNIVGGTAPYNFTITGLPAIVGYISNAPIPVSPLATTNFTISGIVTDANGCNVAGSGSALVNVNPIPTASISGGGTVCSGNPLPNVVFTFTGTAPFDFTWSDGVTPTTVIGHPSTTFTIVNALAGIYSITSLTDATTCPATSLGTPVSVVITATIVSATLSGSPSICASQTANISVAIIGGVAPYSFTIPGIAAISGYTSGDPISVTPVVTTPFTLSGIVTDANGCTVVGTGTATVTVNPSPSAPNFNPVATTTYCVSQTITPPSIASPVVGSTYRWYNDPLLTPASFLIVGTNPTVIDLQVPLLTIAPPPYTIYVTETNSAGCPGPAASFTITIVAAPALPVVNFTPDTYCIGATINPPVVTSPVSGSTYSWYSDPSLTLASLLATVNAITPTNAELGFSSASANTTIVYVAETNSTCQGSGTAVTLTVNGIGVTPGPGVDTWVADVYDDLGNSAVPYENGVDFANSKYRGYLVETEIGAFGTSSYNSITDEFDMNLSNNIPLIGINVCGSYLNNFSTRFQIQKNFATGGLYTFNLGSDDGVQFYIDGILQALSPPNSFSNHAFTGYSTVPTCITAGNHDLVIEYFENAGFSRVAFNYSFVPFPTPSVTVAAVPGTTICPSTNVTFTATPVNGGITPTFQWKKNGINVGSNTPTYSDAGLIDTDIITVDLTTSIACATTPSATSSPLVITVTAPVTPLVSIGANPGSSVCASTNVIFTATPTNGGASPSFQWRKNGVNVGLNSATYADASLNNGDNIDVVLTSGLSCTTTATATSLAITMTITPSVVPAVVIAANPGTNICSGTSVTFDATPTNEGAAPVYQWKKNTVNVGINSSSYTDVALVNGDVITVDMTSNATCAVPATVTSNSLTITIGSVVPSVSIAANPGTAICPSTNVLFTATPTNGGALPSYQWKKNGSDIVGALSSTYGDASLVNGDVITVVMTSNLSCAAPTTATSNALTMTVGTLVPAVTISALPGVSICPATSVTFTASPTNGGATPSYQWKKNGVDVGVNSATYTDAGLVNADAISVVLTSSLACAVPTTAVSNTLTMIVGTLVPTVSISANPGITICNGTSVTFDAIPTNGGTTPSYQWKKNGINVGANSSSYTDAALVNSDVITTVLTSNLSCASPTTAVSNSLNITVTPAVAPSVSISASPSTPICSGVNVTFTAVPVNGGLAPTYQWKKNGVNVGAISATYSDNGLINSDAISVVMTSSASCLTTANASSNILTINVLLPSNPLCSGGVVNCGAFVVTPIFSGGSDVITRPSCASQDDGKLVFSVSLFPSGSSNFRFTLSKLNDPLFIGQVGLGAGPIFIFDDLSAGDYQYKIEDLITGNSCGPTGNDFSLKLQTTVSAVADPLSFVDATCFGKPNGQAKLTITGGNSPYQYSVDGGANYFGLISGNSINNLPPNGTYNILVRQNGSDACPATVSVTINNANTAITATAPTITDATCKNDDGAIVIGTIAGGVSPYTYRFDSVSRTTLAQVNASASKLPGGVHKFTVIDNIGCEKYFKYVVNFPGLVNYTTTVTNPDCAGLGVNGSILLKVTSSGTFNVGISTSSTVPPVSLQNVISAGSSTVTFGSLSKGTYFITLVPTGAACQTISPPIAISSGPDQVDFSVASVDITCFAKNINENIGGVALSSIKGSSSVDYNYQILDRNGVPVVTGITPANPINQLQASGTVTLFGLAKGDYKISLSQNQPGCLVASPFKSFTVLGSTGTLDTLHVRGSGNTIEQQRKSKISLPDLPTAKIDIAIQQSGNPPYDVEVQLVQPKFLTQSFFQEWKEVPLVTINGVPTYQLTVPKLYAGVYRIKIRDVLGCEKTYFRLDDPNAIDNPTNFFKIDVDTNIEIPNVFTPNNDGANDEFYIRNLPDNSTVSVASRWGAEVYASSNYKNDWNGGSTPDGIYYYRINAGGSVFTGWVEIIRGK
jgi:gliding motility-associated-like protein